jgi:uncharacterized protein
MKVFLDTNVLASAVATRGLCSDVLRETFASHDLLVSDLVLAELGRVLVDKMGITEALAADFVDLLRRDAVVVTSSAEIAVDIQDEDDIPIVAAAVAGGAEVFVTGDKELQGLRRVQDTRILSPRGFWRLLTA